LAATFIGDFGDALTAGCEEDFAGAWTGDLAGALAGALADDLTTAVGAVGLAAGFDFALLTTLVTVAGAAIGLATSISFVALSMVIMFMTPVN
jgi:hypothetical protein